MVRRLPARVPVPRDPDPRRGPPDRDRVPGRVVTGDAAWRGDVRLGWRVTDRPGPDGQFRAVRHDGETVTAPDRERLICRMAASDIVRTWRRAGLYE